MTAVVMRPVVMRSSEVAVNDVVSNMSGDVARPASHSTCLSSALSSAQRKSGLGARIPTRSGCRGLVGAMFPVCIAERRVCCL